MKSLWRSLTRPRHVPAVLAALAVAVVAAGSVGPAGAQTGDPIVFDVTPPTQTTAPGTQVDVTFTVSDVPPCVDGDITTLDSLDFTIAAPSAMSTIASWSFSEPPGSVSEVLSPDATSLSLLFDSGFPCLEGTTETITVVVTLNVPTAVPSGTQLTLTGDARGFVEPTAANYLLQRTATVLVQSPPPVAFGLTPPTQTTAPGTTVDVTATVSDVPPCGADEATTLDSLDFELTDPSGLSTIDSFTTTEPPGSIASNISADGTALTVLFAEALPCLNGTPETITVVVTLIVPAGVPSGTQLTLDGDARGFANPPGNDYLLQRTATVLVEDPPPPPPPPDPGDGSADGPGDGPDAGNGSGGGAPAGVAGTVPGGTPGAVAATALQATVRFTG